MNIEEEILLNDVRLHCGVMMPKATDLSHGLEDLKRIYRDIAIFPKQTHSLNVKVIDSDDVSLDETDGIITFRKNLPVGILTADCVPILLYAPDVEGLGAVHAGWKGSLGGIVERALDVFESYGADLTKLMVMFGPSICEQVYEVDYELGRRFENVGFGDYVKYPNGRENKPHVDLQGVNCGRLMGRGVRGENIFKHRGCSNSTMDEKGLYKYQSYRREGSSAGRMLTYGVMSLPER